MGSSPRASRRVRPGEFEPENHFYPRVLNAQIHPLVRFFLGMDNARIAARYSHLHPLVKQEAVLAALTHRTSHFRWGGADLFHAADAEGVRRMYVIETNSCPSGQKSIPRLDEMEEQGSYRRLLSQTFVPMLKRTWACLRVSVLAVLYDKNFMEVSGYASVIADLTGEDVWLVPCFVDDDPPWMRVNEQADHRDPDARGRVARGAGGVPLRDPEAMVADPAGHSDDGVQPGRGVSRRAGETRCSPRRPTIFTTLSSTEHGLRIESPETIWDVSLREIPIWVERMGGCAVVKNPYSNAGQGVWTITSSKRSSTSLMESEQHYDQFIVQQLIGNVGWSSRAERGAIYHVGTVPNRHRQALRR